MPRRGGRAPMNMWTYDILGIGAVPLEGARSGEQGAAQQAAQADAAARPQARGDFEIWKPPEFFLDLVGRRSLAPGVGRPSAPTTSHFLNILHPTSTCAILRVLHV